MDNLWVLSKFRLDDLRLFQLSFHKKCQPQSFDNFLACRGGSLALAEFFSLFKNSPFNLHQPRTSFILRAITPLVPQAETSWSFDQAKPFVGELCSPQLGFSFFGEFYIILLCFFYSKFLFLPSLLYHLR